MYDLHCHILPNVDDGPSSWDAALALARALVDDGVTVVAATPHGPGSTGSQFYDPVVLRVLVDQLRTKLQAAAIPLQVVLGTEVVYDYDVLRRLIYSEVLPYGRSHAVLLETPSDIDAPHVAAGIAALQAHGYRVVLAHPERVRAIHEHPNLLVRYVEQGVLTQITAACLSGKYGPRLQAMSEQLVSHHLAHVIASDSHAATGHRAPAMRTAYMAAVELAGEAYARSMVETVPYALVTDGPLPPIHPRPIELTEDASTQRQRWWSRK